MASATVDDTGREYLNGGFPRQRSDTSRARKVTAIQRVMLRWGVKGNTVGGAFCFCGGEKWWNLVVVERGEKVVVFIKEGQRGVLCFGEDSIRFNIQFNSKCEL